MFLFFGLYVAHAFQAFALLLFSFFCFKMKYLARYWHFFFGNASSIFKWIVWNMNERSMRIGMPYKIYVSDRLKLSSANRVTILFFNHFPLFLEKMVRNWFIAAFFAWTLFFRIFHFIFFERIFEEEKKTHYQCTIMRSLLYSNGCTLICFTTASLSLFTFSENHLKFNNFVHILIDWT